MPEGFQLNEENVKQEWNWVIVDFPIGVQEKMVRIPDHRFMIRNQIVTYNVRHHD